MTSSHPPGRENGTNQKQETETFSQVELTKDEEVVCGDLLRGEGGDLAVVEARGEDAGLVYPHHLGGDQATAGVGQQVLRPHPGPAVKISINLTSQNNEIMKAHFHYLSGPFLAV